VRNCGGNRFRLSQKLGVEWYEPSRSGAIRIANSVRFFAVGQPYRSAAPVRLVAAPVLVVAALWRLGTNVAFFRNHDFRDSSPPSAARKLRACRSDVADSRNCQPTQRSLRSMPAASTPFAAPAITAAPEYQRMCSSRKSQWLAIATLGLAMFSTQAGATALFTFQRFGDTKAIMTATGSVDPVSGQPTGPNDGWYKDLELRNALAPPALSSFDGATSSGTSVLERGEASPRDGLPMGLQTLVAGPFARGGRQGVARSPSLPIQASRVLSNK
jgi:hypothetical protein